MPEHSARHTGNQGKGEISEDAVKTYGRKAVKDQQGSKKDKKKCGTEPKPPQKFFGRCFPGKEKAAKENGKAECDRKDREHERSTPIISEHKKSQKEKQGSKSKRGKCDSFYEGQEILLHMEDTSDTDKCVLFIIMSPKWDLVRWLLQKKICCEKSVLAVR